MNKVPFLLICGSTGFFIGGSAIGASAQIAAPHAGANPTGICTKSVGVTYYPAQDLGCFVRPQVGGCHCEDWDAPPPPPPGPVPPGWSGHSGWSDDAIDNQFLAHLKERRSNTKGAEKKEFKLDVREFKENLKADRD